MSLRTNSARALRKLARTIDPPPVQRPKKSARPAPAPAAPAPKPAPPSTSTSAPGSRAASMFFDNYPRFYETSSTHASRGRLNLRYEAIIAENADIFEGARVLDIGAHDGRWALAALAAGAKSVIGIEPRSDLVQSANESLAEYGFASDRYTFMEGDVFEIFQNQDFDVDVVICLGFLYHTLRYNELFHGIRKANPRHVLIDTAAKHMMGPQPTTWLKTEPARIQGHAFTDRYTHGDSVLVGGANLQAIRVMTGAYGFGVERLSDWAGILRDNPGIKDVGDYHWRKRVTVRCTDQRLLDGAKKDAS